MNFAGGETIGPWFVTGQSVDLHGYAPSDPSLGAHSGIGSLDLAGYDFGGGISQYLTTVPGLQYTLGFWSTAHPYHSDPNSFDQINIQWGETSLSPVIINYPEGAGPANWTYYQYDLVADSESTLLGFSTPTRNGGPILDDISVTAVPEPSALALAPLGVGLWYFFRRSRRVSR